jgi:pyruvate,water dikinase
MIRFFDDGTEPDHALLGGKCASLVAMTAAGMPVPPGFTVSTAVYEDAVGGLLDTVRADLAGLDHGDLPAVDAACARIRRRIRSLDIPAAQQILDAYDALQERCGDRPVAVRSSATAEDLPDASFAGQQDTYLWVRGRDTVLEHVRRCWASLYTCRAVLYRHKHGIPDEGLSMAVGVQAMLDARVAGVAITMDPATGDRSKITIDASYGVGEMVVSGRVTPDNIVLDKVLLCVVAETIGDKHAELVADGGRLVERAVDDERRRRRCLTDDELAAVARLAKRAEQHYGCPQDVEWAISGTAGTTGSDLYLLQARPETVHSGASRAAAASPRAGDNRIGIDLSGITAMLTTRR